MAGSCVNGPSTDPGGHRGRDCNTSIQRFESARRLHTLSTKRPFGAVLLSLTGPSRPQVGTTARPRLASRTFRYVSGPCVSVEPGSFRVLGAFLIGLARFVVALFAIIAAWVGLSYGGNAWTLR